MTPGRDGSTQQYRLLGGVVCFPSHWSLLEKLGQDLPTIHSPVPRWRYAEHRFNNRTEFRLCFWVGMCSSGYAKLEPRPVCHL